MFAMYKYVCLPKNRFVQKNCTREEIEKYISEGYKPRVIDLGSGVITYRFTRPIYRYIEKTEYGNITKIFPTRSFLLERYHQKNITARCYSTLADELNSGKITEVEIFQGNPQSY